MTREETIKELQKCERDILLCTEWIEEYSAERSAAVLRRKELNAALDAMEEDQP